MKSKSAAILGIIAILGAMLAAAILWLGNTPMMPLVQTVNQVLPNDRIPH